MTTAHIDAEDVETTRSEKLLAVVLAGFLLVGGLWVYFNPLDRVHASREPAVQFRESGADRAAVERLAAAGSHLRAAQRREDRARIRLADRREAFRTALEAHQPAASLEASYRRAARSLAVAETASRAARGEVASAKGPAAAAQKRIEASDARAAAVANKRHDRLSRETFFLRLGWVLLNLALGFRLLRLLRRRRSRYMSAAVAFVGYAALQAVVMAVDYATDYVSVTDAGPLVLSLAGIAMTLVALAALQRFVARRVPQRRVRRRECPFCGFPAGAGEHCEGCGREVIADCAQCSEPRRVGTPHCAACGAA